MLTLYCTPDTISVAAAIALREAGLDATEIQVDFGTAEQTGPAYHAINPKGRVPALVTADGVLTETGAILDHIADLAPSARLRPDTAWAAARMREVMYYLASTMHVNHAHMRRGARWADDPAAWRSMAAKVPQTMTASARYIDTHALTGPFVLGDRLSLADPYLFVVCGWLPRDQVDLAPFPAIRTFLDTMESRASVKAVRATGLLT